MANTYTRLIAHIVFSTKNRQPTLLNGYRKNVYSYLCGIIRHQGGNPILVNGVEDHVHVLTNFPKRVALSDLVRSVKGSSSNWISDTRAVPGFTGWQVGYSAFTVDPRKFDELYAYIKGQEQHHQGETFQEELVRLLEEHGVEYEEQYLWT